MKRSRDTAAAWCKEGSFFRGLQKLPTLVTDFLFQFVQQHGIVLADGVNQGRKQEVARRLRSRQKASHQIAGPSAFPVLTAKSGRVKKSPLRFVAIQKALLEQAVERRHHGGVGEFAVQLLDYIPHAALPAAPDYFHDLDLERPQHQLLAQMSR